MILVVDYDLKKIEFRYFGEKSDGARASHCVKDVRSGIDAASIKECVRSITGRSKIKAIAFRLLFGGDIFDKPVLIDKRFLKNFEKLTGLFPFYIPSAMDLLKVFGYLFKDVPMVAFFETSFFCGLPDEEKYYAIPFEYCGQGKIRKWGFHGIFHEAGAGIFSSGDKTISVVFGKQTTVCGVHKRVPLSISLGYTPLEGIMSRTACGDLDPGIVFYLMNTIGLSIYEIDEMLKNKSGFLGLTGYDIEMKDMFKLRGRDDKVNMALDVYRSHITKHIGEALSVLGGLDNIVFSGENVDIFVPIIHGIIKDMAFLGIHPAGLPWDKDREISRISSDQSRVKAYINRMSVSRIIFYETGLLMSGGKN